MIKVSLLLVNSKSLNSGFYFFPQSFQSVVLDAEDALVKIVQDLVPSQSVIVYALNPLFPLEHELMFNRLANKVMAQLSALVLEPVQMTVRLLGPQSDSCLRHFTAKVYNVVNSIDQLQGSTVTAVP